jgi:hypothetical protein
MRVLCYSDGVRLLCVVFALAAGPARLAAADDVADVRETGHIKVKKLIEISGVAASGKNPGVLWLHNDGSSRLLYAVDTSGKLVALVSWPNEIEDFEDITIGPGPKAETDYLYVGDIGDNEARRKEIRVIRFEEPRVSDAHNGQLEVDATEEFRLTYPDEPHNAEALITDPLSGDLLIVTKENRGARLFTCPASDLKDNAVAQLRLVGKLDTRKISGGAISRDGRHIILRREDQGWLWSRARGESL